MLLCRLRYGHSKQVAEMAVPRMCESRYIRVSYRFTNAAQYRVTPEHMRHFKRKKDKKGALLVRV